MMRLTIEYRSALVGCVALLVCGCQAAAIDDERATMSFGERQVEQMLSDRPDMVGVLPDDHPVRQWIVAGFNGDRFGQRVYWNASTPYGGQPAEHWTAYAHYPPQICLSGGTETTPIDKWTSVVYELFNIENDTAFDQLATQAAAGELDRDEYALSCARLEFAALKKTQAYLRENPLPASPHGNDPYYHWLQSSPETSDEYFAELEKGSPGGYSPIKFFLNYYDESLAPLVTGQPASAAAAAPDAAAAAGPADEP